MIDKERDKMVELINNVDDSIGKHKIIKYGRAWYIIEPTRKLLLRNVEDNELLKFWSKEQALSYCEENNLKVDEEYA
jgi:hypothetical protein